MIVHFNDESRAQEPDAGDDVRDDVESARLRDGVGNRSRHPGGDIREYKADHGEDAGTRGDDHLGPNSGFFADDLAFQAKQSTEDDRDHEPQKHLFKRQHCINISITGFMRTNIADIVKNEGKEVELFGWVHARRDHGKLVFIDLRDRSGFAQVVFGPNVANASDLRLEYVVRVKGEVKKRPPAMVNDKIPTGHYEIGASELTILNPANPLPFPVDDTGYEIHEETRLQYRYLDIRRERIKNNLVLRHRLIKFIRDFLNDRGFLEIETPNLTKSTPEGARDYLVPSRVQKGNFYALPQSPQQYKQLLMVGGIEKYFQIARCFRDEDTRGDRQPEFTQLDMELSFVEQEDVLALNEELLIALVKAIAPGKMIQEMPFPRMTYKDAVKNYGTDRPDIRKDKNDPNVLAFCWVVDFPFFEKADGGGWTFTHNPFSAPKPEFMADLLAKKDVGEILTTQYDVVMNGMEIGGGSIRNHRPEALEAVFEIMGFEKERIHKNFGHMLDALGYGAPPHGGIAWGLDRLVSLLAGEPNIREVIAFPKTGDGRDPMMQSPAEVDKKQLDELGLEIKPGKNKEKKVNS
jgi:aspartyl-tRNA synthetase